MKYGICQWCMPGDGIACAKLAAEAGYDGVQLDLGSYRRGYYLTQRSIQEGLLEAAERYGIEYPSVVLNDITVNSITKNPRNSAVGEYMYDAIKKGVDTIEAMNIEAIMLCLFFESYVTNEEEFRNATEAFQYCCDVAMDKGKTVYIESILSIEDQLRMYEMIDRPNLYIFCDTQNYDAYTPYDQMDVIKAFAPYMGKQFHFKDGYKATSNRMLGEGPTSKVIEQLHYIRDFGFDGWAINENNYDQLPIRLQNEADQMSISKIDLALAKSILG